MPEGSSQHDIPLPPRTTNFNFFAPATINLLGQSAAESTTLRANIDNIISDLRVLSQKCQRDIDNKFYFNIEYYRNEFNRILTEVKQHQPESFEDIDCIQDVPSKSKALMPGSLTAPQVAKLYETDAEISKVYGRLVKEKGEYEGKVETLSVLERIFDRFHGVTKQLGSRHDSRSTIDVSDEYDVQDLIHGLLKIYFDDIRTEEWTPSYAGSCSRMDFLLKDEQVVIEVKKTRESIRDKEIGEQLIVDIAKYGEHPDCKTLVCFVYDPEGRISNPTGLENDLVKLSSNRLDVKAFIFPK